MGLCFCFRSFCVLVGDLFCYSSFHPQYRTNIQQITNKQGLNCPRVYMNSVMSCADLSGYILASERLFHTFKGTSSHDANCK